jgi:hypothetical protein
MGTRTTRVVAIIGILSLWTPITLLAQVQRDPIPLRAWPAPLYWQPTKAENELSTGRARAVTGAVFSDATVTTATTPVGSLVFVGMTPCRIADTRDGTFPAGFGPPSLVGNASRTFAIQSLSSRCPVPSIAQAYSFNITVVPPGTTFPGNVNPSGALGYLTIWPTGVPQPVVSTLNSFLGTVVANAAIVPAGSGGSVDVYVFNSTDVIIDINGYYAPQTGITLAQGTATAPALSFSGDAGTGIFSSGAGTLNIATGGTNRLNVASNGNVGIGTPTAGLPLTVNGSVGIWGRNQAAFYTDQGATLRGYVGQGLAADLSLIGRSSGDWLRLGANNGNIAFWANGNADVDNSPQMVIAPNGTVGIGTTSPSAPLEVQATSGTAIYGTSSDSSTSGIGVFGFSGYGNGVYGFSGYGNGVYGTSNDPVHAGVYGFNSRGYAGWFEGKANVTGCLTAPNLGCSSDARLKQSITPLSYGLPEVLRLRPVTWQWQDATKTEPNVGLIAQDVEPVLPELVIHNADNKGSLGLNYMGLVPVTINAIQQQQAQIEDQQKLIAEQQQQIAEQQEQNRKLEERLAALEKLLSAIQPSTAAQ